MPRGVQSALWMALATADVGEKLTSPLESYVFAHAALSLYDGHITPARVENGCGACRLLC